MKRKAAKFLLSVVVAACLITGAKTNAKAASQEMEITAINLPVPSGSASTEDGGDAGGEAVLVKSQKQFLLMDAGSDLTTTSLINALKQTGVTELDVYISHLHTDHYGGLDAVCQNFKVNNVYLPDKSIGTEYKSSASGATLEQVYKKLEKVINNEQARIIYLKKGSTFSFGNVNAKVLGPVGSYTMSQFKGTAGDSGSQSGHYLNNYSLTTMLTCGNTNFLTGGDIEKEEETALLTAYGSALNADILKLSHHGVGTSSTEKFLEAVSPTFSFGENSGHNGTTVSNGKKVKNTYTAQENCMKYGICIMLGDEEKNMIYQVKDNKVTMYRGTVSSSGLLTGWVKISGIEQIKSGAYTGDNTFYIDPSSGLPLTGVQIISGKYYYLGTGGCMEKGYYEKNKYIPYRSYGEKIRHFSSDGVMTVGFKEIDGNKFYFDKEGYKKIGDKKWGIYKLDDGNFYAINENGAIFTNKKKGGWKKYSSKKLRYFEKTGVMAVGWKKVNGKKYYLDLKNGYRTLGVKKIGKYTYFFHETYGYRLTSKLASTKKGDKYLLDSKGHACTGLKKYKGKYYYFDDDTAIMQTGLVQSGTKLYYLNTKTGAAKANSSVRISGKTFKTNNKGMIKNPPSFVKKKTGNVKVTAGTGKIKVTFKKISGVTKYEVLISSSPNGAYKVKKTTSGTKVTISGQSGTVYYVKVRGYKKYGKVKIYSKETTAKSVTIL